MYLVAISVLEGRVLFFSVEPGLTYTVKENFYLRVCSGGNLRDRIQSVSDMQRSADTGTKVQGDAAFADYTVNIGVYFRL